MKKTRYTCTVLMALFTVALYAENAWIRINQLGYLPHSLKNAVFISTEKKEINSFALHDALTDEVVFNSRTVNNFGAFEHFKSSYTLNFTDFANEGVFYLKAGNIISPPIYIHSSVYDGTADVLLHYMRQQRCGYNPVVNQYCHQHDGFTIYDDENNMPTATRKIDARGGWHDASDYLQYVTTSANAVYQMLFAYWKHPENFADNYTANGQKIPNGIPDILDEAKWGLDWLMKMNPENEVFYHQLADDRDHASFRLPSEDNVDYGWGAGTGRPVYRVTGKPQGLFLYKNRTTGVSSIAGKFASAFALGSELLTKHYPAFSDSLKQKSVLAYNYGKKIPGVCQTAPGKAPYFYEEDNWTDDMELAAIQLFRSTSDKKYLNEAAAYGRMEPVTPWMGTDSARHYQWYPFVNLGHYWLASTDKNPYNEEFTENLRRGIESMHRRARKNPFNVGVPFIWCSNNLVAAMVTQCKLYRDLTQDSAYLLTENALIDWLFGCNPWGTSMIFGLPAHGDTPTDPHSALWNQHRIPLSGGLIDGPVYGAIFKSLRGVRLTKPDAYEAFQTNMAVYHDDYADYSTNEPTMDGTASLSYILSAKQAEGESTPDKNKYIQGGIVQTNPEKKQISLIFSGHEFADGIATIRQTLKKQQVHAAFFFTGDFYRRKKWTKHIKALLQDGHYLGAHSDKHLLYCAWEKQDSLLVTKQEFLKDLKDNYAEMKKIGIKKSAAPFFLPPYEWYNDSISHWAKQVGLQVVNFTPDTFSNADYTTPDMGKKYLSSAEIQTKLFDLEKNNTLNGNILLIHIGTHPARTDKLYNHLDKLIMELRKKGYDFVPLKKSVY